MGRSPQLKVLVVLASALVAIVVLIAADFLGSLVWRPSPVTIHKPYVAKPDGWYELQPNFAGHDQFGPYIYAVETDAHGFRRKPGATPPAVYDVIFLADSFTYGMNGAWDDTFVGMYANDTSKSVLNAGVASYSPTAYLHQYRKAASASLLSRGHTVVIALDVSDVQDEAGIWTDGDMHPKKVLPPSAPVTPAAAPATPGAPAPAPASAPAAPEPAPGWTAVDVRAAVIDALPNTWAVYRFLRYDLARWNRAELVEFPRSAFTYRPWAELDREPAVLQQGYAPLGVAGGLQRVEQKVLEIMQTADRFDARVFVLIYPWPAQVANADRFSWSAFASDICRRGSCAGVIDTIPIFRALAAQRRDWLNVYYVSGDTHFSRVGNRVVADAVIKALSPQRSANHRARFRR